ncbi:hemopexin repeat-containing protein [Nonomuraea sp. NPDC049750]|uniref:hemopexin repeat-containing protein n=1 Tax=Nonomuraea sp. NPDC049750 TaxID=3154738 RepID=UPI0033EFA893
MRRDDALPSYEQLFGELDFYEGDEARSVYSPAAYLVDLLRLLEGVFRDPDLLARRPDLARIPLDAEHTFTESPYLDIVNEVLETVVGSDPYETLRAARHPFGMPFSLLAEQFKMYLRQLKVAPEEFYRLFAPDVDPDVVARLSLALSAEDVQVVTVPVTSEEQLRADYGLGAEEPLSALEDVERFRRATGLTTVEVRELVYQGDDPQRPPAKFFVNGGNEAPTAIDGRRLVGAGFVWFERVNRFVRLARKTGLSMTDLDRVLTTCCDNQLDAAALRTIAVIVFLQKGYELTVDGVCGLAVPIEPAELEDLPEVSGDILATHNKEYRRRLARSIETAENDIVDIVLRYRDRYAALEPSPFDRGEIGLSAIALLQRAGRLVAALGLSVGELFDLLEVLESDPSLQRYTTFPILGGTEPRTRDCYRILEGSDVASSLWLAQTLLAVGRWMQDGGFSAQELADILGGGTPADDDQVAVLDGVNRRFESVAMSPELFVSRRFGERASQVLHDVLTAYDDGVVSARDERLLRLDRTKARQAAYDAVTDLGLIVKEDFVDLGLDERLTAKIFANLVFAGRLQSDGALVADGLPKTVAELRLARDYGSFAEPLFKLINSLGNGTASFFPSDLASLGNLREEQQAELYDNLVFNGYLDSEGDVIDPGFFADEANAGRFMVNADLDDVAPGVLAELLDRVDRFRREPLTLDPEIFAELGVDEAALLAGLRFNGYLDEDGGYLDKVALAGLRLDDFGLALEFYPRRRAILDAMKEQIAAFQKETYAFTPDDFVDVADDAIAQRVIDALEGPYLREGRVLDESVEVDLGDGFRPAEQVIVAGRIAEVLKDEQPYRLDLQAVTELGFDDGERADLVSVLVAAGHLDEALAVPEDRLDYFRAATNALDFTVPGVEDYAKELFFLLHPVAKELAAAVDEITDTLERRAEQQRAALWSVLADAFGVPAATVEAICGAVTGGVQEALDVLAAPALIAAEESGEVTAVPPDPHFRQAYRRIRRFALLAAKLGLDPTEVTVSFQDQDLVGKYPEPLALPPGLDRFDAVLDSSDGNIYLFGEGGYWTYAKATYALADPRPKQLIELSTRFTGMTGVDAAFAHPDGSEWIIGHGGDGVSHAFVRERGGTRWAAKEQVWGKVRNNFDDPQRIDSAFVDEDGKTYLFSGDQYIRYTTPDYTVVDEGYPRGIDEWWQGEGHDTPLPKAFKKSVDASFQDRDGGIHLFTGQRYLAVGGTEEAIADRWGRVRNVFDGAERVDAAYADASGVHLFAGNQVIRYSGSIENDGVRVDDGYPRRIESDYPSIPGQFESGVEAALADWDGAVHLFKDGRTAKGDGAAVPTAERWGVQAPVLPSGTVDAAFTGLDGKTYLFSGGRYLRYSGADYSVVDLGYPRAISADWGGLREVGASFVMDGKTYLFGAGGELFDVPLEQENELNAGRLSPALRRRFMEHGLTFAEGVSVSGTTTDWHVVTEQRIDVTLVREAKRIRVQADAGHFYVRYSTRDYATPDVGYPKPVADNWWNLPAALADDPAFTTIDAVFSAGDGQTYLFSGERFVVFDHRHRWWSEPRTLREHWDSIPFTRVDAAFIGKDGRTYVFSGDQYARYSTRDYTRVDDRYPASVPAFWGNVISNLARTGRVDATLVMDATELVEGVEVTRTYTYLFSGNQYVRYEGYDYTTVQEGYPRALADLHREPRLGNLSVTLDGVDAAFADRRNVYLFRGARCHVVSSELYRSYDDLAPVSCAFVEDGAVLVEGPHGWRRLSAIEGTTVSATPVRPRTLRPVPEEFRTGLDAVLEGADGTTYLFKGPNCFNTRLNRAYPLTEEWGRPRNTIYQDNAVDAAFTGVDGKTYLFSGDQFVTYTGTSDTIDGDPLPIADHWAGLTGVALAYVRDGRTYVFEHPDDDGMLRYLLYSGEDYRQPDDGYPMVTDAGFWEVPGEESAAVPDAVLFEGGTMLLLYGERCVQFDEATGRWSYPRPTERIWRDFGRGLEPGDALRTAFTAPDGATYFFFRESYARYADHAFSPLAPIRERWGRALHPFTTVDAACVYGGQTTFLFSGDQYVRYTNVDYRYVDPGYPKKIIGNLRQEEAFARLPEAFEDAVTDRPLDAVLANRRNLYLFVGGACHVVSVTAEADYDLGLLGGVRNTLVERQKVDAALVRGPHTFLFSGDQYVRYTNTDYRYVDDGYPRTIDGSLSQDLDLPNLPDAFADGLDAAFRGLDGGTYLFKGPRYLRADRAEPDQPVNSLWGKVRNAFADGPGIEAAFAAPTGELYAFKQGQYIRYQPNDLEYVATGYPRTVKDDWGDLPAAFEETGPDGAFVFEGRTYLLRDDEYVRYSGAYDTVDRTFPQPIKHRWSDSADYRLSDLHTIVRFVELARSRPDGLAAFLLNGPAAVEDPYRYLADLFGWDADELRWAKRNAALLTPGTPEEDRFEIEFVLKLVDVFAAADKFDAGPSTIYTDVWSRVFGATPAPEAANTALSGLLERTCGPADWVTLSGQIHDELNLLKRDALAPSAIIRLDGFRSTRDLYEKFLIDADMGAAGRTSRVREAIAATQLFVHRYLLDLEEVALPPGRDEDEVRRRLKTWWGWLKNYRLWEANRKVFLYPENYLRPELRSDKTPAFQALESDLLQGEITPETVQRVYKRYLDEYTEVSRLAIAGGYVYPEDGADEGTRRLVLFGRTRTAPRRYYYRGAEFRDGVNLSATWEPWLKVDVQIDADRVYPVHAFGRVFVFWTVVETVPVVVTSDTTIDATRTGDTQNVKTPPPMYRVKIYYSFLNLNGEWGAAQLLAADGAQAKQITGVRLYVQASRTVPGGPDGLHDSIIVTCSDAAGVRSAFALTPELYAVNAEGVAEPPRAIRLDKIFAEPDTSPVDEPGAVRFNMPAGTLDRPWLSVDHKGGSFLCRPVTAPSGAEPLLPLGSNPDGLPKWKRIDAAFELPDGRRCFFDNAGKRFKLGTEKLASIKERWGIVGTGLLRSGVVDAVLVRGGHIYVFSGAEYYRYSGPPFGAPDTGYPKPLNTNPDNLPHWTKVDAAFTLDGTEYFLSFAAKRYVDSTNPTELKPISSRWELPKDFVADSALAHRDRVYFFAGDTYIRFSGKTPDDGPQPLSENTEGLPQSGPVDAAFSYDDGPYFFDNTAGTYLTPDGRTSPTRELGRIPTTIGTTEAVDAAYVDGDKLYLTSGMELVRYTLPKDGTVPDYVDDGYPKQLKSQVKAVIQRNRQRYVLGTSEYALLEAGQEPTGQLAYRPVAGNWGGLPEGFQTEFTGVLDGAKLYLFLGADYVVYSSEPTAQRPYEFAGLPHEIVRLTSSTAYRLNKELLTGGVAALLAPETQETDELPAFSFDDSDATTIKVRPQVAGTPSSSHLDFQSANGIYYWEIFFHAPLLIAQALNNAQRFEDARIWYEYVFDPTERVRYWRFLPFLAVDLRALVDSCRADLAGLGLDGSDVATALEPILARLATLAPAFEQAGELSQEDKDFLAGLAGTELKDMGLKDIETTLKALPGTSGLRERIAMIAWLRRQYDLMGDRGKLIKAYMDDPFDPHAIAELRPSAYRRAVVMAYIDNLLDWGDLLFRQYTAESVDEARMLYIFAYDLLGERPDVLGPRPLSAALTYEDLRYLPLAELDELDDELKALTAGGALLEGPGEVHRSVASPYFYVPENSVFFEYWSRVEDRLRKIRQSLDIMGVSRPLPLFEPPADVMALVKGAASGASLDQLTQGMAAPVPYYRFAFVFRKAQDLADKVRQFGNDLLNVLERRDVEELALLQNRQEGTILALTRGIKEAQIKVAEENLAELEASRDGATARVQHYEKLIADGLSALQVEQLARMKSGSDAHFVAGGLKIAASIALGVPQALLGPFIFGTGFGGEQVGNALDKVADVSSTLAEGYSTLGELIGVRSEQERTAQDWDLQLNMAKSDVTQLGHQLTSAQHQLTIAQRELAVVTQDIANQEAVAAFMKDKFAGAELYHWMAGRMSGLYFQTYNLAYEMARSAERAYQFERGESNGDGGYIQPRYWESRRNGLLAGDSLGFDLERLGKAYVDTDSRGMEITKKVSLLGLDPLALLALRGERRCEFALTEALFDRDFPGHFRRRIRTLSVSFLGADGPLGVYATLTQLDSKTVLAADPKAVKFLLDPKGAPPDTLRPDWRSGQQIALSDIEEYKENNGLFELRLDDDRYLPFEGTGAVSRWRLQLSGPAPAGLSDVVVTVKYSADQGGEVFANAVKGMLKPYASARYFDVASEFPDEWAQFQEGEDDQLVLPFTPALFPAMSGRQITGVYPRYELAGRGSVRFLLNGDKRLALADGKLLRTPGLSVGGNPWVLVLEGDKAALTNLGLVLTYRASVQ